MRIRSLLAFAFVAAAAFPVPARAIEYKWRPDRGTFLVRTDRSGLFSRMGHRHEIRAESYTGTFQFDPASIEMSRIDLVIASKSLRVVDHDMDAKDIVKIQGDMERKVLEVGRFPEIRFLSNVITNEGEADGGGGWKLRVSGTLALHGVSQPVAFPALVTLENGAVRLKGEAIVKQKDFEIEPISVGMGAVTVKNEVRIEIDLVADAEAVAAPESAPHVAGDSTSVGIADDGGILRDVESTISAPSDSASLTPESLSPTPK